MVKKIYTDDEQKQQQFLKEQKFLKSIEYKTKKMNRLNIKINKCDLPTLKIIYDYLIKNKIMCFNDGDIVKFDTLELTNENIRMLNKIITDNYKFKVVKVVKARKSIPVKNYNMELILFDDI